MHRRQFLASAVTAGVLLTCPRLVRGKEGSPKARYVVADSGSSPLTDLKPLGRRAPFGWKVGGVSPDSKAETLELRWNGGNVPTGTASRFRVCVLDTREPRTPVEVRLLKSGDVLGQFDLQWVGQFQVFEIPLTAEQTAAVLAEGVSLRQLEGELPVWIILGTGSGPELPEALHPHLLLEGATDPLQEYFARMNSLACVQPFGWMEGCVLDGLRDLSALPAYAQMGGSLQNHLDLWFKKDGKLVYENARGNPVDQRVSGIESTLPFAALAWERPDHPALKIAEQFWLKAAKKDPDSCIIDGQSTSSEGAYTVGYPLAVLAKQRDKGLAELALKQVMVRQQRLFNGKTFYRTSTVKEGSKPSLGNRNWCRGVTWQFLGLVRTVDTLQGLVDTQAAQAEIRRMGEWIMGYQLPNGNWSVFVDNPQLLPDTSGSAGIAAALAIAANRGWLGSEARTSAEKCFAGLQPQLTPDGFLGGASQSNKGGEGLQRGSYRVNYQMGMGLMAQLYAALNAQT